MAPLTVNVRLSGPLAQSLGARRTVGMDEGATVYDLLEAIARAAGVDGRDASSLAAVAGGSFLARSQALTDGDELDVLVPVAGG
ncbi:MAG TPA: MoaD/ThiS family protein [Gaiellaceae bacterium]|jgi:molybdopterin converting factor small subunit|nr:MoaD/ThiS family protein [Gaiellaceae bacterium]